jgi:hypothetical protein
MMKKQLYIKTIMNMVEDSTLSMELNKLKRESSYKENQKEINEEFDSFSQLISIAFPQTSGLMNDK